MSRLFMAFFSLFPQGKENWQHTSLSRSIERARGGSPGNVG